MTASALPHPTEHLDVVIIGAGLSGIGAARYLKKRLPKKSFAILEGKPRMGGTWDLFRYPGIRSDSDMHTMGYAFKPWTNPKAIADGRSILDYIKETARENRLEEKIRYNHKVADASWSSDTARWTLTILRPDTGETISLTCSFLFSCAGYYKHERGYLPDWPGYGDYRGKLVHPQFWPEDLDYQGKRIILIGSGATAVTLTPALAEGGAAEVIQLQRSPGYLVNRPSVDAQAQKLRRWLPERLAYAATRWRIILMGRMMRKKFFADIQQAKKMLIGGVAQQVGDAVDWKKHFVPRYMPGQQRMCVVPDGDFFRQIKAGKIRMVTDEIERFTETGILTKSGERLEADIIITATGLILEFMGGIRVTVDGQRIEPGRTLIYRGFMYSNIPNLIYFTGYFNASWTLKVDLVAEFACRLLRRMDRKGAVQATAVAHEADFNGPARPQYFTSGYVTRAAGKLPRFGSANPWLHEQDYFWDRKQFRFGPIEDNTLRLTGPMPIVLPPAQRAELAEPVPAPEALAAE